MSLKFNQVMISIHYVPYLGRIQGSVKSSQNNVIVNYLCTVKVHRCVVGACRLHGDSNLQHSIARGAGTWIMYT